MRAKDVDLYGEISPFCPITMDQDVLGLETFAKVPQQQQKRAARTLEVRRLCSILIFGDDGESESIPPEVQEALLQKHRDLKARLEVKGTFRGSVQMMPLMHNKTRANCRKDGDDGGRVCSGRGQRSYHSAGIVALHLMPPLCLTCNIAALRSKSALRKIVLSAFRMFQAS